MKIISLVAENVKRLTVVEIKPDGNLVQITGKNGAGKSSVLDAIWWALASAEHIQAVPIRRGATEARIKLDLGEIKVTRSFKRPKDAENDEDYTTTLVVENAEGARFPTPQRMLDGFLGALTFDPLAFARMKPADQFDALRQFVPGVDFAAIDGLNKRDFQSRTDIKRRVKELDAAARQIVVAHDTPAELVDESALVDELQKAGEHNAAVEKTLAERGRAQADANEKKANGVRLRERAAQLRAEADEVDKQATNILNVAGLREKAIDAAPPLPAPIDTAAVRARITEARNLNARIADAERRRKMMADATMLQDQADALTKAMEDRTAAKDKAIADASLPVAGLGFGDGRITLDGLPFEQASDAEQLRASLAIAMASNPKLRVIRVRDGSLLDDDSLRLVASMAEAKDYQVWLEKVSSDGKVGFVLEDGHLKQDEAAP